MTATPDLLRLSYIQVSIDVNYRHRPPALVGKPPNGAMNSVLLPPVTQPERNGRFAKQGDKCLSEATFCPLAKHLRSGGDPKARSWGALLLERIDDYPALHPFLTALLMQTTIAAVPQYYVSGREGRNHESCSGSRRQSRTSSPSY